MPYPTGTRYRIVKWWLGRQAVGYDEAELAAIVSLAAGGEIDAAAGRAAGLVPAPVSAPDERATPAVFWRGWAGGG